MKCLIMSCVIFCSAQDATGVKRNTEREDGGREKTEKGMEGRNLKSTVDERQRWEESKNPK